VRTTCLTTRALLVVASLAVVLAACSVKPNRSGSTTASTGPVGPFDSADFHDASLSGTVVHADGTAAAGVSITVTRLATNGEKVGDLLTAMFTGGLACIPDNGDLCTAEDSVIDQPTTGSDGGYATALPRAYVPGYQTDADWLVAVTTAPGPGEASGPSSSYEMEVNTAAPVAPALTLWDAAPAITGEKLLTVSLPAPSLPADATPKRATTDFLDARGTSVLSLTAPTVDARLLEDLALRVVGAREIDVVAKHVDGSTTYHQHLVSAGVERTGTLVPLSRGKSCAASGPVVGPCPLTDGDLATAAVGPPDLSTTTSAGDGALVDLGATADVGLVVARGCSSCRIDTSTDAATWEPLGQVASAGVSGVVVDAPDRPRAVRYVRVTNPAGLSEISVWPADRAASRGGSGLVTTDRVGSGSGSGTDWAKVVAVVLAVVLIGAVGVAVGRRSVRSR
jgi:hypothetical protein